MSGPPPPGVGTPMGQFPPRPPAYDCQIWHPATGQMVYIRQPLPTPPMAGPPPPTGHPHSAPPPATSQSQSRERKVIPILNPYTREVVAVPPLPPKPVYEAPASPTSPPPPTPPATVAGIPIRYPPEPKPQQPTPAFQIEPEPEPEPAKEFLPADAEETEEVIAGLNILSMGTNISDALALLKGSSPDAGLNLNLLDMEPEDLLPPAPTFEEAAVPPKEEIPAVQKSPALKPMPVPVETPSVKEVPLVEEAPPVHLPAPEAAPQPKPKPQSSKSPALPPAKPTTPPEPVTANGPAAKPVPKPEARSPPLHPSQQPSHPAAPAREAQKSPKLEAKPKPAEQPNPVPKPAMRGWEKVAAPTPAQAEASRSPPLRPTPVPSEADDAKKSKAQSASATAVPKESTKVVTSWADEEEDLPPPPVAPSEPMSLADRLRASGVAKNSKRSAEIKEMQRLEQERKRQREEEKEQAHLAEQAAQEEARRIAVAKRAAAMQPITRTAPPPSQAVLPKPFAPRREPVKEPPPGEWGVAMSKKTRNMAMKASPDAPIFRAEQAIVQPKGEEKRKKEKVEKEKPVATGPVRLSEEALKPYRNKFRNLQKKFREIEELEALATLTEIQKAKVATKKQLMKELKEAEHDYVQRGGTV
eukprot:GGOE01004128.1.p1 GENE.GGOE01004128.1~~GGOE01004128.1.p1  ORF type:complete len:690 (-),score=124.77 GGOE01004128.1:442-2367(-)